MLAWPPLFPAALINPDAGQWILALAWLLSMIDICVPMAVKLLPMFGPRGPEQSLTEFLREMAPDEVTGLALWS